MIWGRLTVEIFTISTTSPRYLNMYVPVTMHGRQNNKILSRSSVFGDGSEGGFD